MGALEGRLINFLHLKKSVGGGGLEGGGLFEKGGINKGYTVVKIT